MSNCTWISNNWLIRRKNAKAYVTGGMNHYYTLCCAQKSLGDMEIKFPWMKPAFFSQQNSQCKNICHLIFSRRLPSASLLSCTGMSPLARILIAPIKQYYSQWQPKAVIPCGTKTQPALRASLKRGLLHGVMHGLANVQKGVQDDGVLGGLLLMPRRHWKITGDAMSAENNKSMDLALSYWTYFRSNQ